MSGDAGVRCAMAQGQADPTSGQKVLSVELSYAESNTLQGVLVLPFGLAVQANIELVVDDREPGLNFKFSTCLPSGCLVPISFDNSQIDDLRNGGKIKVRTLGVSGDKFEFTLSLVGFSAAFARLKDLSA